MTGMEMPHAQLRRPRFKRRRPPPLSPTDDDIAMLRHVAEHRFLRSTHLIALMQRPADKILRRLAKLFHHGYLDRPRAQLDLYGRGGSAPIVYGLGNKAAQLFGEPDTIDWTDKNRSASRPYIEHTLMVADFMVALECAVRSRTGIRLVRADDIATELRRTAGFKLRSWTMTAAIPDLGIELSVKPDKVFALEFADTGRRNYFVVEADRATMPVERADLSQSSFKKKLLAYHHGHEARQHVALWGIPGFRVLTLTSSADRLQSMIDALFDVTDGKGSNAFMFATSDDVLTAGPLALEWRTGKGHLVSLPPAPNLDTPN
jgi:hypothetical protein